MKVLILSCSTGGGHNSAGRAVKQALEKRGHQVIMTDPYELKSHELAKTVGDVYVKTVQRAPKAFGEVYRLGNLVRRAPGMSPVYFANIRMAKRLERYLAEEGFDAVVMPHLFPAEIITYLKRHGMQVPVSVFLATDYTCIPFTEETDCDYYIVPTEDLVQEFVSWGIPRDRLIPLGIPVGEEFTFGLSREEAKRMLGLEDGRRYLTISGGSMGAGDMSGLVKRLAACISSRPEWRIIVICGSNEELYHKLDEVYRDDGRVLPVGYTGQMAAYIRSSDLFLTKPGGLTSTEAAAAGVPLVHIAPIPGCESRNLEYFRARGMSFALLKEEQIPDLFACLESGEAKEKMVKRQREYINPGAAEDICRFLEETAGEGGRQ